MRRRRGSALLYVIVMGVVFLLICRAVMDLSIGGGLSRARAVRSAAAKAELDGAAARVWACLDEKSYPSEANCQPTGAQRACLPAGLDFTFSGSKPDCRMRIRADR